MTVMNAAAADTETAGMAGPSKTRTPGSLRAADCVIFAFTLSIALLTIIPVYSGGGEGAVSVSGDGASWVYPLDSGERLVVSGPLGDTVVDIRDGRARILSSPCTNQTCVASGAIHARGQWLACLPNRVMVRISGQAAEVDAASY
jgi:hypothetical protein